MFTIIFSLVSSIRQGFRTRASCTPRYLPSAQRRELWVSDIDGGNKLKLATGEFLATGTRAPDNFHLSFEESEARAGAKAYVVGADGSGLHQLPPMGGTPNI